MGSLNDYLDAPRRNRGGKKRRPWRLLLIQTALSAVLFFMVAGNINTENIFGEGSRYIATMGLAEESSWLDLGGTVEVSGQNVKPAEDTTPVASSPQGDEITPPDSALAEPQFTAPASGVVVTDLTVTAPGFSSTHGIQIQGAKGQSVKAAAAGSVGYMGKTDDGYLLELLHAEGFSSVYQGLSELTVTAGETVESGAEIGKTEDGELTFSLFKDGEELDPLEYLFR